MPTQQTTQQTTTQRHSNDTVTTTNKKEKKEKKEKNNKNRDYCPPVQDLIIKEKPQQTWFVDNFKQFYEKQTNYPYKYNTKDFKIANDLISKFGMDMVIEKTKILAEHCEKQDLWFCKAGWCDFTIGKLSQFFNELLPLQMTGKTNWAEIFKKREETKNAESTINQ